jgi:hypothetical protein
MTYSAVIGTLSEYQANNIQSSMTKQCLARYGFNRHLPNAIVYGPKQIGGIGFNHLFASQGTIKVRGILQLLRLHKTASSVLRAYLSWAQLIAGTSTSILIDTSFSIPSLKQELWISSLREFLTKSHLQLYIRDLHTAETQCVHDRYIMDIAHTASLSNATLLKVNRCRIFLHAITLADITDLTGKYITQAAYECTSSAVVRSSKAWPFQPHIGKAHIKAWQAFLHTVCHQDTTTLELPLGKWYDRSINSTQHQRAFYNTETNTIATKQHDDTYAIHGIDSKRRYSILLDNPDVVDSIDFTKVVPAIIHSAKNQSCASWRERLSDATTTLPSSSTSMTCSFPLLTDWECYVTTLSAYERHLLDSVSFSVSIQEIQKYLTQHEFHITIVSDASFRDSIGTYTWIMDYCGTRIASSVGAAFGFPMTAYRAERTGKLAWTLFLQHISKFLGITIRCAILSYCDNITVVKKTLLQLNSDAVNAL